MLKPLLSLLVVMGLLVIPANAQELPTTLLNSTRDEISFTSQWQGVLPVTGTLSSLYGVRLDPFTSELKAHLGLDVAAVLGAEVASLGHGTVIESQMHPSYGEVITIEHGKGLITRYAHLSERLVQSGDVISYRQIIGKVGQTGRATGPHLHVEVKINGAPINPLIHLTYLREVPVTLASDHFLSYFDQWLLTPTLLSNTALSDATRPN